MSSIYADKKRVVTEIVGRKCDNCGYTEMSNRAAIKFDHSSDKVWAKLQLSTTYTIPENNRHYYMCSSKCVKELAIKHAGIYLPISSDSCFGGIPLEYWKEIVQND